MVLKNKTNFLMLLCLLGLFFVYGFNKSIFIGPYAIHQWRQADCLSIVSNYYYDNLSFLEPAINWCDESANNKTVSEFPVIYYATAQLWKLFDKHEWFLKAINLTLVLTGIFLLFKTIRDIIKSNFWAIFCSLLLFSSQILVYYSNNFIANTPAFGLALIALYFAYKYYTKGDLKNLYLFNFLFLLAGLIKITALMSFIGLLPIHLVYLYKQKNSFKSIAKSLIPFVFTFTVITIWYKYAAYYNHNNISGVFLQGILPIWDIDSLRIIEIKNRLIDVLIPSFFYKKLLYPIIISFIYILIQYKKANKFLLFLTLNCWIGSMGYLLLFYQVFDVHDYYLINLLILIPLMLVSFLDLINRQYPNLLKVTWIKIIASIILVLSVYNTAGKTRIRYDAKDLLVTTSPFVEQGAIDMWSYGQNNYENTLGALNGIEPYLRSLGINRNDLVISYPDYSINISLYLMNQKGFTNFGYGNLQGKNRIEKFKKIGAKYLIINAPKYTTENSYLLEFTTQKTGTYKNVSIYKL